ncbi:hypothetical protein F4809DRAFT_631667, partial [Biscogniauxia mediterranea]
MSNLLPIIYGYLGGRVFAVRMLMLLSRDRSVCSVGWHFSSLPIFYFFVTRCVLVIPCLPTYLRVVGT